MFRKIHENDYEESISREAEDDLKEEGSKTDDGGDEFYLGPGSCIDPKRLKVYLQNKKRIKKCSQKLRGPLMLKAIKNIRNHYEFSPSKLLHKGWFGQIYSCKEKNGTGDQKYALKTIKKKTDG